MSPLELAEFAAIALQRRYFFLFLGACGRVLLWSFRVLRPRRAMQLGRIDALDADRHLAAVPNDGLLADEGILEDVCAAEALRRGVFAELKAVRVDYHIGGVDVGIAVRPELRQIDRAADPQKTFHIAHGRVPPQNAWPPYLPLGSRRASYQPTEVLWKGLM